MYLTSPRLLKVVAAITVAAFLLSGALRNADHGVGNVVGIVTWFTFLLGLLTTLVLGTVEAVAALRRRRMSQHPTI